MANRATKSLLTLLLLFIAIQVVRPARTNPPVDPSKTLQTQVQVPPNVEAILTRACANCHSNNTRWPWYSSIAPVSWLVVDDVNEGRSHLNFSDWEQRHRHEGSPFDEVCKQVRDGEMPPWYYRPLHPEARLAPADVETLCAWTAGQPKQR